jgi:hypothetical protein
MAARINLIADRYCRAEPATARPHTGGGPLPHGLRRLPGVVAIADGTSGTKILCEGDRPSDAMISDWVMCIPARTERAPDGSLLPAVMDRMFTLSGHWFWVKPDPTVPVPGDMAEAVRWLLAELDDDERAALRTCSHGDIVEFADWRCRPERLPWLWSSQDLVAKLGGKFEFAWVFNLFDHARLYLRQQRQPDAGQLDWPLTPGAPGQ